ncbi:hypothetical protein BBO99_00009359 [Phytophthora kernoviae]|uniref:Peptidase M13 C-terminal domain-containing protein n=1 Tax=Phytophthora kernoviae TaxID=325452 RepID=A0A421GCQ8_9STRA|nr:hypothetical protein BBO99_00009359 [Phytophthora kernoviae]
MAASTRDPLLDVAVNLDATTPSDADDVAFLQSIETFKDATVDPCVDFYQYACGGWLASHEIPPDRPSIDASFYVVSESNKLTIQQVIKEKPAQITELYTSCLNDQEVDADAVAFVSQLIDRVHETNSTLQLMDLAGELYQSLGISTFFSFFVGADPKDPTTNVVQLEQGGFTLPSREYYLEQDKVDEYATLVVDYVTKLFAVGELDKHDVSEFAEAVLETETAFAKVSLPNAALRDPWKTNTAYPFADIAQRYPFLMAYMNGIYKKEPFPMLHAIVATPAFFEQQNKLLQDETLLPQLKNYLSFHLVDSFGAVLGEYFRRASHEFHGAIQGAGAILPRDQFCVGLTTAFLGEQLGEYYMRDVFGPDAKAAAQALVAEIEESLQALLSTEKWLDKVTYDAAVAKLGMVKNYIGGPDVVPPLPFTLQGDAFFNNVRSLMELSATEAIQSINMPVDPQAWDMFPSTVNAYYDPSANKMVFPAAILQPPFYSPDHFPAAANFARIGMVMGHELSHGFDDQGRNYDGTGALRSWWTPSVSDEFAEKAQCLSAQYSTFPVVSVEDGHVLGTINGNLTLGENIADNGGIHLAYEAYHLWKSTFSPSAMTPGTEEVPPQPEPSTPVGPVETPPVIPIPDQPVPEPSETGPGGEIPEVTVPDPDALTPEPAPNGEIPVVTPSRPPVIPEPQPADVGPGEVIPEVTSPAPVFPVPEEETPQPEPATDIPVVTPPSETEPPAEVPAPVPSLPFPEEPTTSSPSPGSPTDTSNPPPETKPSDETPDRAPAEEHDHKKASDSEKHKKSDKLGHGKDGEKSSEGHKHSPKKHEKKDEEQEHPSKKSHGSKHGDVNHTKEEDDQNPSKGKHTEKHGKNDEDDEHRKHHGHKNGSATKDEGEGARHGKNHGKDDKWDQTEEHHHHEDSVGENGRHKHRHNEDEDNKHDKRHGKDSESDKAEEEHHHHDDSDGEGHRHKHKHGEDEDRHEQHKHHHWDEENGDDEDDSGRRLHDKYKYEHYGREKNDDEYDRDEYGRHGRHSDEEGGRGHEWERREKHRSHDHKRHEERREERKKEHKEREEERKEERAERKEEREEERRERREERSERKHEHKKHHHHRDWDREYGCGREDGRCGRHGWIRAENSYPFSGGDVKIRSMVAKLARSLVQPDDPVADDRLFFTAFAQNWCEKRSPAYAELLRMIDPHSPGKWRVNGPLMNYDKFAEVFQCPVGSPMNPEKKCVIW